MITITRRQLEYVRVNVDIDGDRVHPEYTPRNGWSAEHCVAVGVNYLSEGVEFAVEVARELTESKDDDDATSLYNRVHDALVDIIDGMNTDSTVAGTIVYFPHVHVIDE